jgi:hypothetical protein
MPPLRLPKRPTKLLPIQPLSAPDVPPQFRKQAVSQFRLSPFLTDLAPLSGSSSILSLPHVISDPKQIFRQKSLRQKRDLASRLSTENLSPQELFDHLATCNTTFAKFFRIIADELEFTVPRSNSDSLEKLATDSAIESAQKEVEWQREFDRLTKIQTENTELAAEIKAENLRLESMNSDITNSHFILSTYGIVDAETTQTTAVVENEGILPKITPVFDQQQMIGLWNEQQELLETIAKLEERLHEVQQEQMTVMHERARSLVRPR